MEFNHPVREFIWVLQKQTAIRNNEWFNFSSLALSEQGVRTDLLTSAGLQFDGFDRFQSRDASYFRLVQPWQRHEVVAEDDYIYLYSLALRPDDLQPSGSVNASRIDSIVLQVTTNQATVPARGNCTCRVYAKNHNVLRVVDGFGGVLFTI
jgi:Large eukaryotic DNA virus major capsid protein